MQESWKFKVSEKLDEKNPVAQKEVINRILKINRKEMGIFLSYYYKSEGGLVEEVEISNINLLTPFSGTISVKYSVVYFNACLDIHSKDIESMTIQFTVNTAQNTIKFTGPRWPEREPDEI